MARERESNVVLYAKLIENKKERERDCDSCQDKKGKGQKLARLCFTSN